MIVSSVINRRRINCERGFCGEIDRDIVFEPLIGEIGRALDFNTQRERFALGE